MFSSSSLTPQSALLLLSVHSHSSLLLAAEVLSRCAGTLANSSSAMSEAPPPSGIQLDDTHFDCLLLGTSLTNTLLAAALSKLGKKVLHIDRNDYYGGFDTSLPFNDFAQLLHSATSHSTASQPAPSVEQIADWRSICGDCDNQRFIFHSVAQSSSLHGTSFTTSASTAVLSPASGAATSDSAAPDVAQPLTATSDASTDTPPAAAVSTEPSTTATSSAPLSLPPSQSRLFSLDLTPHLLLSRAALVDLLIASSTSSYMEFKAVDRSHLCLNERSGLQQVPVSRSAVFTSTLISVSEKRQLMRLLNAVMPNHKVTAQQEEEDRKDVARQPTELVARAHARLMQPVCSPGWMISA